MIWKKLRKKITMKLAVIVIVALSFTLSVVNGDEGDPPPPPTPAPPPTTPKPTEKTKECEAPTPVEEAKDMPALDDTFQTTIEAKFLKRPNTPFKPYVVQIREYTDKTKNRRAVFTATSDSEKHVLFDLAEGHAFAFNVDAEEGTCSGNPLDFDKMTKQDLYFKFSVNDKTKTGSMMGLEDIYDFSMTYKPKQTNKSIMVRNIECEEWTTCISWDRYDNTPFKVTWYWSKDTMKMPMMKEKTVPVRVEVKGGDPADPSYHHIYDFISYINQISDPSILWPEMELLCYADDYYQTVSAGNKFPDLPDTFSVDLEQINGEGEVTSGKYVMDSVNRLMRTDLYIRKDELSFYKDNCGNMEGICKIIHDFSIGLEYVIKVDGSCSVFTIPVKQTSDGFLPQDILPDDQHLVDKKPAYVTMATAKHLFKIGAGAEMEYQGERLFRGVNAKAWVVRDTTLPKQYNEFLMKSVTKDGKEVEQLWGYIHKSTDKDNKVTLTKTNFYNFDRSSPDLSAFDIHYCFTDKDSMTEEQKERFEVIHAKLELKDKWDDVQKLGMVKVQTKLRQTLAQKAVINALRITDIMIAQDKDDDVHVWFTILWASPITGSVYMNDGPHAQKDVEKAEEDLKEALKDDVEVEVTDDKQKVTIKGDSLKTNDDAMKGDPRPSQQNVVSTGHSTGQVAGVGIGMLLVGAVVGMGVGFYLWRRRGRGVPYQIHH